MQPHDERASGFRFNHGIIPALAVIGVGVLFLLNNMNIVYVQDWWRYWPVILIAAGLAKLVDSPSSGGFANNGIVMIVAGALFLADTLGFLNLTWRDFWPVILIGAGLWMLWNRLYTGTHAFVGGAPGGAPGSAPGSAPGTAPEGQLNLYAVFGGVERKVTTDDFRGGQASAMFGGVDLNLRKAGMRGESAVIDLNVMFGGVDIKVPMNWIVVVEGTSVFGGFSDKSAQPSPDMPGVKRLFLRGSAVFGGVNVKN